MLKLILTALIFLFTLSSSAFDGEWHIGKSSKLQSTGLKSSTQPKCETFDVELSSKFLQLKVQCGSYFYSHMYSLGESKGLQRLSRKGNVVLLTHFDYYGHKIQTQNDKFEWLRMPYVNEVIRIEKISETQVSVFRETFQADELGRIASDSSFQAVSLEGPKGLKPKTKPKKKSPIAKVRRSRVLGS